jgi:phage gp36-like protein
MPYCRLATLYTMFGEDEINQLADTDRSGTPSPELVARAIKNADAEIDAALLVRYVLPLSPVPQLICRISGDLTRWFLYGVAPTKEVDTRAKLARDLLKSLAAGEIMLEGGQDSHLNAFARIEKTKRRLRWGRK